MSQQISTGNGLFDLEEINRICTAVSELIESTEDETIQEILENACIEISELATIGDEEDEDEEELE